MLLFVSPFTNIICFSSFNGMPGLFLFANLLVREELLDPLCIIRLPVFLFSFKAFQNFRSKNGFFYCGVQEGWLCLEIHKWWAFWRCSSSFKYPGKYPVGQKSTESNIIMAVCLNSNPLTQSLYSFFCYSSIEPYTLGLFILTKGFGFGPFVVIFCTVLLFIIFYK